MEQQVQDLKEEHKAAKVTVADLQEKQKMISQETLQLREQCSNYVKEITYLLTNGTNIFYDNIPGFP